MKSKLCDIAKVLIGNYKACTSICNFTIFPECIVNIFGTISDGKGQVM